MLDTLPEQAPHIRMVCRPAVGPSINLYVRTVRPSQLNWRASGDAWVVDHHDGGFALCLGDDHSIPLQGTPFDLPSFNQILDRLRYRRPRHRR